DLMDLLELPVVTWPPFREKSRIVPEQLVLDQAVRDVDAETVDAAVEPETHDVVDGAADLFVPPVEVGLLRQEVMEVVLAAGRIERPRRALLSCSKHRAPVVRRAAVPRVGPHVPVPLGVAPRRPRRDEPRMLVGGVVRHEIDQHADLATVRLFEEMIEVAERAKDRVDVAVVGDVVAEVLHRRAIERREPDRLDTERPWAAVVQMIEPARDAGEVADTVAVRVLERTRVDLIEDALAPPRTGHV